MLALFGHQSVGQNLLHGIRDLEQEGMQVPALVGVGEIPPAPTQDGIAAFRVGENRDPFGKLRHFAQVTSGPEGRLATVALFKFCYVDVEDPAKVQSLFEAYTTTIDELRSRAGTPMIAHVTVPLRRVSFGPRTALGLVFGRHHPQALHNGARHAFNERLRERYAPEGKLFDLAALEARDSAGRTCTSPGPQGRVPMLAPAYTGDGGHLNGAGRRTVARAFLDFLRQVAES